METEAREGAARPRPAAADRLSATLGNSDGLDESRLRLGIAVLLSLGALYFFRLSAAETLGAAVGSGLVVLVVLYIGFHQVGVRQFSRLWPGASRGLATALLVACLCPPGLPPALVAVLGGLAVLSEGVQRRLAAPVALNGVLIAWGIAWLWWARTDMTLLAPITMRPQDEPIMLWTQFQLQIDPLRLYAGNVAGPIGATSFGLATVGVLVLGYARRVSWLYLAGFLVAPVAALAANHQPLEVYLLCGEGVVLVGIVGAEVGRLPQAWHFRLAAGLLGGAIAAVLFVRGLGAVAYGIGVLGAAVVLTALQAFDILGARTPTPVGAPTAKAATARATSPLAQGSFSPLQLALLVLLPPVGLFFLWRNQSVPDTQRIGLVAMGSLLYVAAVAGSFAWLWLLRLPT
ncbi:MAG TPA: hypothetical protein VG329_06690 [Candidatus Dormibacteraeota bacterium]|nr:hypothetical protein [Candidatus Dormibacteraeota bacterium]